MRLGETARTMDSELAEVACNYHGTHAGDFLKDFENTWSGVLTYVCFILADGLSTKISTLSGGGFLGVDEKTVELLPSVAALGPTF